MTLTKYGSNKNNESTATEPPPKNVQQPKPRGEGLHALYWYQIFVLNFFIVKTQEIV